jgi:hypothetical protein
MHYPHSPLRRLLILDEFATKQRPWLQFSEFGAACGCSVILRDDG